ncbi:MAG: hypothetical protein AAFZ07_24760 [Actinomycetota bacterium]
MAVTASAGRDHRGVAESLAGLPLGRRLADRVGRTARDEAGTVVPLAVLTAMSTIGTVGAPALWSTPMLLVALAPRLPFLLVAASSTALLPFVVVASARLLVADPFHFDLGRRHGPTMSNAVGRRLPTRLRRLGAAVGPDRPGHRWCCCAALVLRPSSRILAWSGAIGLRPSLVAGLDVGGTVAYVVLVHAGMGLVL